MQPEPVPYPGASDSLWLALDPARTAELFPFHAILDEHGRFVSVGRTLARLIKADPLGLPFDEVVKIAKPRYLSGFGDLSRQFGERLTLSVAANDGEPLTIRGVAVPRVGGGIFLDINLGAGMTAAVERFSLTVEDFGPNDLSADLFYAVQTQRTLLEDSARLADALKISKDRAEKLAFQDMLTGIGNRRAFARWLDEMRNRPSGTGAVGLLHFDLNNFKAVNDLYGHVVGDAVLRWIAETLEEAAGRNDLAVRLGGDEFALLIANTDDVSILELANHLVGNLSVPFTFGKFTVDVAVRVGAMVFDAADRGDHEQIVTQSYIALSQARTVKQTVTLLTPDLLQAHREDEWRLRDIERAISENEFRPYFQPQIDLGSNRIRGLETVARWHKADGTILPPSAFIGPAVRAKLMDTIDFAVRRQALQSFSTLRRSGIDPGVLSLNITASNLRGANFLETLLDELIEFDVPRDAVELELVESILFDRADTFLAERCRSLIDAGLALALDDFGTGHTSMTTLIDTEITLLKIDRSFVSHVDNDPSLARVTASVAAMARELGIEVLAEGVERREEIDFLSGLGCNLFQGYYFARPMPPEQTRGWAQGWLDRHCAQSA